jgi:tetratricopeptide (TPR) repeat protein
MRRTTIITGLFVLSAFLPGWYAMAAPGAGDVRQGNDSFRRGKFSEALEHYEKAARKNPSEARIAYDLGAAAYKAGAFDRAVEHFQKSLLTDDDKLRKDVYYNLGNAFYQAGIVREQGQAADAVHKLEASLDSLQKALALDPKDRLAAENYAFVSKELEKLKLKQQKESQQSQQCPNPKKDQGGKDDTKDQSGQKGSEKDDASKNDQHKGAEQKSDEQKQEAQKKEEEQKKEEQKKEETAADSKDPKDGQPQQEKASQDSGEGQEKKSTAGQAQERQISSVKDANDMVDDLERNELPKGLLNFIQKPHEERPVQKDW